MFSDFIRKTWREHLPLRVVVRILISLVVAASILFACYNTICCIEKLRDDVNSITAKLLLVFSEFYYFALCCGAIAFCLKKASNALKRDCEQAKWWKMSLLEKADEYEKIADSYSDRIPFEIMRLGAKAGFYRSKAEKLRERAGKLEKENESS